MGLAWALHGPCEESQPLESEPTDGDTVVTETETEVPSYARVSEAPPVITSLELRKFSAPREGQPASTSSERATGTEETVSDQIVQ